MAVVATAGHVDHGKSTLVRALTGMDPDRLAQEQDRGLTIDLGFAWTRLPSGLEVSFVDVPGHERFLGNMLAGLGPSPTVCFVVAVDEGWSAQSGDHRDAVAALGIESGLVVLTRTDLAPERIPEVREQVRTELAGTGLAQAPVVPVSAVEGHGLQSLRSRLDEVVAAVPEADAAAPVRMWVDRAFTVEGAGTVITGTLGQGTLIVDHRMDLLTAGARHPVTIRGLQTHQVTCARISPVSRAAVNLRGAPARTVRRGDVLATPGAWFETATIDVHRVLGEPLTGLPREVGVHVGTTALTARPRPFDADYARLHLPRALPLGVGDRVLLRGTGLKAVLAGVKVLDVDPPTLTRRGAGGRRAHVLSRMARGGNSGDVTIEVTRRAAIRAEDLARMGVQVPTPLPEGLHRYRDWLVDSVVLTRWREQLRSQVEQRTASDPLTQGLTDGAAVDLLDLPDASLLTLVLQDSGLVRHAGRITAPRIRSDLGPAEPGLAALEARLAQHPFEAPRADDLAGWELGPKELATAERHGRLLRLAGNVVLLPSAPARAMTILAGLDQPFTTSAARTALGTTRRTAIPLLEHLDDRGWTRRVDPDRRVVVR